MKTLIPIGFFLYFYSYSLSAQERGERIYIQTDRNSYQNGETVYFKGYVNTDRDTLYSTHLFVELWEGEAHKVLGLCLPVLDATTTGSLTIPSGLGSGDLFLRAYTNISAGQDDPFQYILPLLGGTRPIPNPDTQKIEFYPEGGQLVYNAINYVAIKAPPGFTGSIRNSREESLFTVNTSAEGTGRFRFRPVTGEKYSCTWKTEYGDSAMPLPVPVEKGVALHLFQDEDSIYFDLDIGDHRDPDLLKLTIEFLMGSKQGYTATIDMSGGSTFSHQFPLKGFQTGQGVFRVLDREKRLLASRPLFISRKSLSQGCVIESRELDLSPRGLNILKFSFADSTVKSVAVSISDAGFDNETTGNGLLQTVLPAGVPTLISTDGQGRNADRLDLFMLANKKNEQIRENNQKVIKQASENYLRLTGLVKNGKKILANKELIIAIRSPYSGKNFYKLVTDETGRFVLDGLVIFGDAFVYCKLPGEENTSLSCELELSMPGPVNNAALEEAFKETLAAMRETKAVPAAGKEDQPLGLSLPPDSLQFTDKVIVLEEAFVKTSARQQAQKRMEELESRYLDGTGFAGYPTMSETLNVLDDPVAGTYNEVLPYIASHMRSIKIRYFQGRQELVYPIRGINGDTIVRTYFLNGTRITRDLVDGIRLDEIALVKFIPMLGSEIGLPPAVIIFMKRPGETGNWEKANSQAKEVKITGYPVTRVLPMPDYDKAEIAVKSDTRRTIFWDPYLPVHDARAEIRFYNNDITRKFRIKIEGISADGNIIRFEEILE